MLVEVEHLLRERIGAHAHPVFLEAVAKRTRTVAYLTPELLRRPATTDASFASSHVGFIDSCVMAVAERQRLPVLTFDFEDFPAAASPGGTWQLVVDENRYRDALG